MISDYVRKPSRYTAQSHQYARNFALLEGGCFYIGLDLAKNIQVIPRPDVDGAAIVYRDDTSMAAPIVGTLFVSSLSRIRA